MAPCTSGTRAQLASYTSPWLFRPAGICTDAGSAILTVKKSGMLLRQVPMHWYDPYFSSEGILLTDHFIDAQGHDLGRVGDVFEFFPRGPSGDAAALTADHPGSPAAADTDDGGWHLIHKVDPYRYDGTGLHAHWAIPACSGGHTDPGFAGYLRRYLGATDLYLDIARNSSQGVVVSGQ